MATDPGQPVVTVVTSPEPGVSGAAEPTATQPVPGGPVIRPVSWMPAPPVPANCPQGLEYLSQLDQLLVKPKVEILEAPPGQPVVTQPTHPQPETPGAAGQPVSPEQLGKSTAPQPETPGAAGQPVSPEQPGVSGAAEQPTATQPVPGPPTGFETKYEVLNIMGQRVYYAVEVQPDDIKILDSKMHEVIHLDRPLRCTNCLCCCCLQKTDVQAPRGTPVGYVRQESNCGPRYKLNNERDETVLLIKGPCCRLGDVEFDITSADGQTHVGKISKKWPGLAKEIFTDADNLGVSFPLDLDVKVKATALGALFLIGVMHLKM